MSTLKLKSDCGYLEKPPQQNCSTCAHFTFEKILPAWMLDQNKSDDKTCVSDEPFTVERNGVEKNLRCSLHGFAVKKLARCNSWKAKAP